MTMVGPKITCYFDGQKLLEADDATFPDAGRSAFGPRRTPSRISMT